MTGGNAGSHEQIKVLGLIADIPETTRTCNAQLAACTSLQFRGFVKFSIYKRYLMGEIVTFSIAHFSGSLTKLFFVAGCKHAVPMCSARLAGQSEKRTFKCTQR